MKEVQALKEQNTKTVALEEMVQNLSEQKVDSATEIDKLRNETLKLKQVLEAAEASKEKHERQFKRINDENYNTIYVTVSPTLMSDGLASLS